MRRGRREIEAAAEQADRRVGIFERAVAERREARRVLRPRRVGEQHVLTVVVEIRPMRVVGEHERAEEGVEVRRERNEHEMDAE